MIQQNVEVREPVPIRRNIDSKQTYLRLAYFYLTNFKFLNQNPQRKANRPKHTSPTHQPINTSPPL
jgi:hypothetical protein